MDTTSESAFLAAGICRAISTATKSGFFGFLALAPEEVSAGWNMIGCFAHSPRMTAISEIPHDQFDERLARQWKYPS